MSFILDALKKSENERQKQSGPALFEVKVAPPAARFPVWAVIVGVLLGVNLIVLIAVLLLRDKQDPAVQATQAQIAANAAAQAPAQPPPQAPTAAGSPSGAARPTPRHAPRPAGTPPRPSHRHPAPPRPRRPARRRRHPGAASAAAAASPPLQPPAGRGRPRLADEPVLSARGAPINPADYQPATAAQTPHLAAPGRLRPAAGSAATPSMPATAAPATHPAAPPRQPPAPPGSAQTSGVPSRDDLIAAGKGAIPEANVSLHVYDKNPAARFVFVNGQRAREGDVLANGLRVDEIRADGAVLSFRGARFLVPIQ